MWVVSAFVQGCEKPDYITPRGRMSRDVRVGSERPTHLNRARFSVRGDPGQKFDFTELEWCRLE